MKLKSFFITAIILMSALSVKAHSDGYIVKLREGHEKCAAKYSLTEIVGDMNLYHSDTADIPQNDCIESISPNSQVSFDIKDEVTTPGISLFTAISSQMELVNADSMLEYEAYGNGIRVAVIDTGCNSHVEFDNNVLEGKNYLTGDTDVTDNIGHGTHVCGTIASNIDSSYVTGVAPKVNIIPLKCFDKNVTTYIEDIIPAIYEAVEIYDCRVLNMSWGIDYDEPYLKEVIDYVYEMGAVLVAAVGNYGTSKLCYPAAYDNVIGVSSVDLSLQKSSFAQYNRSVTVTAPGENVVSTSNSGGYKSLSGTSHSTPLVTGIAAVALSVKPDLTNSELYSMITNTATDLGDEGYDTNYGYGLVNEKALLDKITDTMPYYVSPVNTDNSTSYVLIKNNSESTLEALSIFKENDNPPLIAKAGIKVLPDKSAIVRTNIADVGSHFLWKAENLTPLAIKR